jgi:hypothetical protein
MTSEKKFGVWLDSTHAIIVGRENIDSGDFKILGHVKGSKTPGNSNENASNNHERTLQTKYFKEIGSHLINAEDVHVTGTGKEQEQFVRYLAETAQFKKTKTKQSTSNEMSDEKLIEYFEKN